MLSEQDGRFLKEILKPSEQENFDQLTRMEMSSNSNSGAGKCWGGLGEGLGAPYSELSHPLGRCLNLAAVCR